LEKRILRLPHLWQGEGGARAYEHISIRRKYKKKGRDVEAALRKAKEKVQKFAKRGKNPRCSMKSHHKRGRGGGKGWYCPSRECTAEKGGTGNGFARWRRGKETKQSL